MTTPTIDRICRACGNPFKCTITQIKNAQGIYCSHRCRNIGRTKQPEERFWKHVRKTPTCWLWTASTDEHGYGQFNVNGKPERAHRFSYQLRYGPLPNDKPFVLHHCDTPLCVRPEHLFPGTQKMNMQDAVSKGRQSKGEHLKKLTEENVLELRQFSKEGWTQMQLAAQYRVSQSAIHHIVTRHTWKHI